MKHKDEIWVCNQCSGSWDSLEKYVLKMKNGGFISCCPDSNPRPYLPSSSVKDLVKAARDTLRMVESEFSKTIVKENFKPLIKALQSFNQE